LLKIKDATGRTKFILRDDDEAPVSIDELVLRDSSKKEEKEKEEKVED